MKSDNLIKDNEWLIKTLASKYSSNYNYDDLYQAGSIGLIKAYNNYDKNKDITTLKQKIVLILKIKKHNKKMKKKIN